MSERWVKSTRSGSGSGSVSGKYGVGVVFFSVFCLFNTNANLSRFALVVHLWYIFAYKGNAEELICQVHHSKPIRVTKCRIARPFSVVSYKTFIPNDTGSNTRCRRRTGWNHSVKLQPHRFAPTAGRPSFSRDLRQLHLFLRRFDWFTVLSAAFVIG